MTILIGSLGLFLILLIAWEGFETIILPRRVTRSVRLTRLFYRLTWMVWSSLARRIRPRRIRQTFISYYGPGSVIGLIALWVVGLVVGFALLQWSLAMAARQPQNAPGLGTYLYASADSFFTFGTIDSSLYSNWMRFVTVFEAGLGFGFLALIISFIPPINEAFSKREVEVTLLDGRAGTPPTAVELLRRYRPSRRGEAVDEFLSDWEGWSSELMESHLSYPVLAYFRSQHENQSWLAALSMILDLCTLAMVGVDGIPSDSARLTFAMARHAAVDLTQVFGAHPIPPQPDRLPEAGLERLAAELAKAGLQLRQGPDAEKTFQELRQMYEPYMNTLAIHLILDLPPWLPEDGKPDNWQTTAWEK